MIIDDLNNKKYSPFIKIFQSFSTAVSPMINCKLLFYTDDVTHSTITVHPTLLELTVMVSLWTATLLPSSMSDLHSTLAWGSVSVPLMALCACVRVCEFPRRGRMRCALSGPADPNVQSLCSLFPSWTNSLFIFVWLLWLIEKKKFKKCLDLS